MPVTRQNGDAQNKLGNPQGTPGYSKFPINPHHYTTERFGIIDVCGIFNGIEADKHDWKPAHELTTYTLSAPLMTPVYKEKDYIIVARQALLPRNWDKIHVQPNIGEDIDATIIGTSIKPETWSSFLRLIAVEFPGAAIGAVEAAETDESLDKMLLASKQMWQSITLCESIFSYGSLLCKLGCAMAALWRNGEMKLWDIAMDEAMEYLKGASSNIFGFEIQRGTEKTFVNLKVSAENTPANTIGLREFLDICRENPGDFEINWIAVDNTGTPATADELTDILNTWTAVSEILQFGFNDAGALTYNKPVDLARCWTYQLAVAEYFTNSHVDYIYSAELYRQYIWDKILGIGISATQFTWNGVKYEYDYLSAKYFTSAVSTTYILVANMLSKENQIDAAMEYFAGIFSYHRSLKYLDYYTGSKTRPLAVGDVTINPGAGGAINVIDVTRKGQAYKFLNAVNRIGRKAEDYAQEIMGVKQQHDWHNPLWLGSTRSGVNAEITDNTGEAQVTAPNSQTARLYGVDGKYKFEYDEDRDAIIIGLTWYDVERSYSKGVHRSFMHVDRYDMFNPYLQYTGDQEIYKEEYDAAQTGTFGYVPAYEEFKQEPNKASGGFVTSLPGYTFLDGVDSNDRQGFDALKNTHIGPEFIRSKPVEFDRFYNSLTGYSLGTYFHFILDYYNENNCKRKMAFNPGVAL